MFFCLQFNELDLCCHGIIVINTAQIHSVESELEFFFLLNLFIALFNPDHYVKTKAKLHQSLKLIILLSSSILLSKILYQVDNT